MTTTVFNLATQEQKQYSCPPREAVIAAYAQDKSDFSTWQYEERYGPKVEEGKHTFLCGDWSALKGEQPNRAILTMPKGEQTLFEMLEIEERDKIAFRLAARAGWEFYDYPENEEAEMALRRDHWLSLSMNTQGKFENCALGAVWARPSRHTTCRDLYGLEHLPRPWNMDPEEYARLYPEEKTVIPAGESPTGECISGQDAEVFLAVRAGIAVAKEIRLRHTEAVTAALIARELMKNEVRQTAEMCASGV